MSMEVKGNLVIGEYTNKRGACAYYYFLFTLFLFILMRKCRHIHIY